MPQRRKNYGCINAQKKCINVGFESINEEAIVKTGRETSGMLDE